jgi:preprotein translocase subunit SecA
MAVATWAMLRATFCEYATPTGPSTPAAALTYSGPGESGTRSNGKPARSGAGGGSASSAKEPGRNAPCPCGSGKKYKLCHGRPGSSL